MHTYVPVCAGPTVRRCASCVRVRFPLLTAVDRHTTMGRYWYTAYAHPLPCTPIVVCACRRGGHAPRPRRGVRACMRTRALVCVRGRARIRADSCEHLTPPPSVGNSARRRSSRRRCSTRTSARGTPPPSRSCPTYAPLPARSRTAADCARSVADACAAVVRGGAADACARACVRSHVAMCIRVYVDGSPMDTHLCSSAIERSLHPGFSMFDTHTHRPFPRCMYTCIRLYASMVRARACVRALLRVCAATTIRYYYGTTTMVARCMRANYENLSTFLTRV
jgi:hypothetical protein